LYDKTYRMALALARQAQRAAERELGMKRLQLDIIRNDHWNSQREGLLAAEKLQHDLKRLEVEYLDKNRREFELTKHISLRRLDPSALVNLRITQKDDEDRNINRCEFELPEWLFDLDTAGHYLRRIKSVSLSIPCVVGPFTSVHSKLTLLKSSIRYDASSNLDDTLGATETVVTSTANADSGLFETQLRDERFLPFEGRGAVSRWQLDLPADYPQFDYSTISDVILSLRYTARDGDGVGLGDDAISAIKAKLADATHPLRFNILFSTRSDFPVQWARSQSSDMQIPITSDLLPYWMDTAGMQVQGVSYADVPIDPQEEVQFAPADPPFVRGATSISLPLVSPDKTDRLFLLAVGKS
jgi:Tc toxin complex TcA C-terminal TcB-binding domain